MKTRDRKIDKILNQLTYNLHEFFGLKDPDGYKVDFHQGTNRIQFDENGNLFKLTISGEYELEKLNDKITHNIDIDHLYHIVIKCCKNLTTIEYSFKNIIKQVATLDLSHNSITSIPEGIFNDMPNLYHLNIGYNPIKKLPCDIFNFMDNKGSCVLLFEGTNLKYSRKGSIFNDTYSNVQEIKDKYCYK